MISQVNYEDKQEYMTWKNRMNFLIFWQVMVAESYDISRETYLAILMDRGYQGPVIVGSPKGGVDIEEVAEKTPEHIHKVTQTILTKKPDQH